MAGAVCQLKEQEACSACAALLSSGAACIALPRPLQMPANIPI